MKSEIIKAMNKNPNKFDFSKWWRKNGYIVNRIIFFPIWITVEMKDRVHRYNYKRTKWSEERANEILSYYVPRKSKWDSQTKEFYFADNGCGWSMKYNLRKIKLKDRQFWKKYTGFWGGEMRKYLIEKFELEGFEKTVGNTYDYWTEVTFTLKEGN